jgi:hypothetical protein
MSARAFLRSAALAAFLDVAVTAASLNPVAGFTTSVQSQALPSWSGNALLNLEGNGTALPVLRLIDAQGSQLPSAVQVTVPEGVEVFVRGASRGPDGTVVVCGMAIDRDGRRGRYLATFDTGGSMKMLVRTDPYKPYRVAAAPDGSIWTAGVEAADQAPAGSKDPAADVLKPYLTSGLIRHFDASGKLLASFVPQNTVRHLFDLTHPRNYLVTGGGRVAWYSAEDGRYVEIDSDGRVADFATQLPDPGAEVTGIAVANNGDAFAAVNYSNAGSRQHEICRLDRSSHTWVPVRREASYVLLYGAEGDVLVTATLGEDLQRITFLRVGQ